MNSEISKKLKKNKIIYFASIYLFFFLIGDIIFSNFFYKKNLNHNCYKYTKNFFYLKKNCYAKEKWIKQGKSYDVFTDDYAYRFSGKYENKSNTNQIAAFFGDSFTYGMGLEYKKSFVGIINSEKNNYNIINLGVPGYSPSVFKYQLKQLLKNEIIPSKIFFALDISDMFEEASEWKDSDMYDHPIQVKPNITLSKKKGFFKTIVRKNFKGSRLIAKSLNNLFRSIRYYSYEFKDKPKKPGYSGWGNFLYTNIEETDQNFWSPLTFDEAIIKINQNFKDISDIANSINSDFYILIYPWPDSLEYGQSNFNWEKFANKICKDYSCTKVINFFPDFKLIKNEQKNWLTKLYIGGDLHITEFGQKIIAKKILDEAF